VLPETSVTNEIKATRKMGRRIVPLALARHAGPCRPEDAPMRAEALQCVEIATAHPAAFAGLHPQGSLAAIRRAQTRRSLQCAA
jgi:hypothetical protein